MRILRSARIQDELRALALKRIPFGYWEQHDGCNFAGVPTVGDFRAKGEARSWMKSFHADDRPVFMWSPGEAIFSMICQNCHGPDADSRGRQADNLLDITGGATRVANLRDGLLGPSAMRGGNIERVFAPLATLGGPTAEDLAARYVAWMGLGGTQRVIPESHSRTDRRG